jgi:hypothetical protein
MFTFAVNFGLNENLTFLALLQLSTFKTIIIFYSQPAICYNSFLFRCVASHNNY